MLSPFVGKLVPDNIPFAWWYDVLLAYHRHLALSLDLADRIVHEPAYCAAGGMAVLCGALYPSYRLVFSPRTYSWAR